MIKKIFITGGGGYVGAELVPELLKKGYEVTVLDLFIYGMDVLGTHPNLIKVKGDIRDSNLLDEILPTHDAVIHLACISNDPSFELNPNLGKSINLDAFRPLVEISIKYGIQRFIYASSSSVYGIKQELNVHEGMDLEPLTDYSKFKADCEKILLEYDLSNFTPIIIRPATVCGYSKRQRLDVVVNILTNLAYHKGEITVFGGNQLRPNIHIKDMVDLYVNLLNTDRNLVSRETFNAGYENQKVIDIAESVKSILGNNINIKVEETNDNRSYHISSEKIQKKLGFAASRSVRDAIIDLKTAFDKKLLINSMIDPVYFNIKTMQNLDLK